MSSRGRARRSPREVERAERAPERRADARSRSGRGRRGSAPACCRLAALGVGGRRLCVGALDAVEVLDGALMLARYARRASARAVLLARATVPPGRVGVEPS